MMMNNSISEVNPNFGAKIRIKHPKIKEFFKHESYGYDLNKAKEILDRADAYRGDVTLEMDIINKTAFSHPNKFLNTIVIKNLENCETMDIAILQGDESTVAYTMYHMLDGLFPENWNKFWGTNKKVTNATVDDILNHKVFIA